MIGDEGLDAVLALLERLVSFDTRNPPRAIDGGGIVKCLVDALGSRFSKRVTDLGDGCVSLLAVRGTPKLLFNVHIDTVPADAGWTRDPFTLYLDPSGTEPRVLGLGACDIKGAAACLVVAALRTRGDVALLFTSDEEAGSSRCVREFLEERTASSAWSSRSRRGAARSSSTGASRRAPACSAAWAGTPPRRGRSRTARSTRRCAGRRARSRSRRSRRPRATGGSRASASTSA